MQTNTIMTCSGNLNNNLTKKIKMEAVVKFTFSRYWQWSKCYVCGNYLSNPERQIQEVLETIYYFGWLRLTIIHKHKFVCR